MDPSPFASKGKIVASKRHRALPCGKSIKLRVSTNDVAKLASIAIEFSLTFSEGQEDIKLPTKVEVELRPIDNDSWYYVQSLAQNPRVKTSLPLQKRLISLIKTLQVKWRSRESKLVSVCCMPPLSMDSTTNLIAQSINFSLNRMFQRTQR